MVEDLGLEIVTFQPFRDFEGMPEPQRAKAFSRAERKFDVMQELGCDLLLVCSNVSPDSARRHRPRRGGLPRARRARRKARHARRASRRSPGGATSTITAMPGRWCAAPTTRPSASSSTPSTSSPAGPTCRPIRAIPRTASSSCRSPTRRGSTWITCPGAATTAASRARATCPIDAFMAALQATGFDGLLSLEIFNDRFRAGSARSVAVDGQRSLLFMLDELRRRTGVAGRRPADAAAASDVPRGHRVRRVRHGRESAAAFRGHAARARLRPRRPAPLEGGDALAAGRHQHRRQHATRRASPIPSTSRTGRRSAPSRCGSTTPPRRSIAP